MIGKMLSLIKCPYITYIPQNFHDFENREKFSGFYLAPTQYTDIDFVFEQTLPHIFKKHLDLYLEI